MDFSELHVSERAPFPAFAVLDYFWDKEFDQKAATFSFSFLFSFHLVLQLS